MAQYKTFSNMSNEVNDSVTPNNVEVLSITTKEQRTTLVKNNIVVVIDNYTDSCSPCKTCAPQFASLATTYTKQGICAFAKENALDYVPDPPVPIRAVPCFHFYRNGQFLSNSTVTGADITKVEKTIIELLA